MEWIDVNDRLPDSMIDVLIFDHFRNDMIVGWFNTKDKRWVSGLSAPEDYFEIQVEPTHWMPLPSPPKP